MQMLACMYCWLLHTYGKFILIVGERWRKNIGKLFIFLTLDFMLFPLLSTYSGQDIYIEASHVSHSSNEKALASHFRQGYLHAFLFFFFFLSFFLEELQLIQGKHCRHVLQTLENCYKLFAIEGWALFADVKWSSTAGFTGTSKSCSDTELGL